MQFGVFGGTFDPPHIGHLIMAAEALDQLGLDKVLWVLTPSPPHKQGRKITRTIDRLAMVSAAIEGNPAFELSRIEIDRPPPHYAVDTLYQLIRQNPMVDWVYIMGGDSLRDLPEWHANHEFIAISHRIGVVRRPGFIFDLDDLEEQIPGIKNKVWMINMPLLDVSASQIRARISAGSQYRYYLPASVYQIIQEKRLYQDHIEDRV
jgi:nicotinate-nucleotide adenylyltransferase